MTTAYCNTTNEGRIYHTAWGGNAWWAILVSLGFVGLFAWLIIGDPALRGNWIFWFGMIFFGVLGLFFPLLALWERLSGRPAIVVMVDKVVCTSLWRRSKYRFDEVKKFKLVELCGQELIAVHLNKREERRRLQGTSRTERSARRLNIGLTGAQENIAASALTMKPQALCDLLNERLDNYKQNYGKI